MPKRSWCALVLSLLALVLSAVPPTPLMPNWEQYVDRDDASPSTRYGGDHATRGARREPPQTVLAIMVDFADVTFDMTPDYPDSVAHDAAYFNRYMVHLNDFCYDASHGAYSFDWQVYDRVTLAGNMSFYGSDDNPENLSQLVVEVIAALDGEIDFNEWDALVLFHAGAGQETDIDHSQPGEIWSTFVNKYDLWEDLDPDAEEFDGVPTDDGVFITEMSIVPEGQWQPYFDEESPRLGTLGVLAHEFGHQLGLPTLYDNNNSNGYSQGIGYWGLMGTGAWNAFGYVPPLPCAWSRCYLGWETPVVINSDINDMELTYTLDSLNAMPRVARVDISDTEYFLLENRQQNPDDSWETKYNDDGTINVVQPSFTFDIVENQKYYAPPNDHLPRFDFMTNRYRGAEWDFYLPGIGGPTVNNEIVDGSGLLIWHIDESVIAEKFTDDFELNSINGDSELKGVDLEEADGVQHLDTSYPSDFKQGGPYDAYRQGNNDYFGFGRNPQTGAMSMPNSDSNYGGGVLEIHSIGPSSRVMQFSTRFLWKLDAAYSDINTQPAALGDFDLDGLDELFYLMDSGKPVFWYDDEGNNWPTGVPLVSTVEWPWSFDENSGRFFLPCQAGDVACIYSFDNHSDNLLVYDGYRFTGPIVVLPQPYDCNGEEVVAIAAMLDANNNYQMVRLNTAGEQVALGSGVNHVISNMMADETSVWFFFEAGHNMTLEQYFYADNTWLLHEVLEEIDGVWRYVEPDTILWAVQGDIDPTADGRETAWITDNLLVWLCNDEGRVRPGFPVQLQQTAAASPMLADADGNGTLDIVIGGENRFSIVGYNGEMLNAAMPSLSDPDTSYVAAPVLPIDVDGDGRMEFAGGFSRNRFCIFDDANANFTMMTGYPLSLPTRSRLLPVLYSDSLDWLYIPSDYGKVYRTQLTWDTPETPAWSAVLQGFGRTAVWSGPLPETQLPEGDGIFYPDEVYLFPNPLNSIFGTELTFNIRTRRTTEVSLKIFDIAGNCIYKTKVQCDADMPNREKIHLDTSRLSSGVYFAIVQAGGKVIRLPFGIEK